ncbi:MerR family transcriptional regulator [Spongiactinospora rosea]|uniref:MerR family transcriptional regulator n=1 Tax=Spongiactinospora rosea TaxID=2248750 RepID=A0A366M6M4_9ACTN|nr:MerR family transcriptional regulator [Spongiactinospora rosea]RBQ21891.1 MerR family transcriptional regulator [Spongiactinospora rosea]
MGDTGRVLRPIDLAREAGISAQQVRNYADDGILPPAPRTPSGYRRFDARHRAALLTYRALMRGYGPDAAQRIMLAVHAGDVPLALTVVNAEHAALHEQRLSLEAAGAAVAAVAERPPGATGVPRGGLRIGEVAARLGVRTSALRVWEAAGLLTPRRERGTRYRTYGETDLRDARIIRMLRQGRYGFPQIRAVLDGLRSTGSGEALRAAIDERRAALLRRTAAMLEGSGRLHDYLGGL